MNIIFVCTGNICRSPTAEAIFRDRCMRIGRTDIAVSSMGTHGLDQAPATEPAQRICLAHNIDLSGHRSRSIDAEALSAADWVFCMSREHVTYLHTFFPWFRNRIVLLGTWPDKPKRGADIPDPMGRSDAVYKKVFRMIADHVGRILPLL